MSFAHMTRAAVRFALFSLLAGGMAAVLLVPEYAALHLTDFSEFDFPDTLTFYFSFLDMIARHSMNVTVETGLDHWPNLYCGVAVFLLVPLYAANPDLPAGEGGASGASGFSAVKLFRQHAELHLARHELSGFPALPPVLPVYFPAAHPLRQGGAFHPQLLAEGAGGFLPFPGACASV